MSNYFDDGLDICQRCGRLAIKSEMYHIGGENYICFECYEEERRDQ